MEELEDSFEIYPVRTEKLYPLYQTAMRAWELFVGKKKSPGIMPKSNFVNWLSTVGDDDLRRELRKWPKPPDEWTQVDLEWEGIEIDLNMC